MTSKRKSDKIFISINRKFKLLEGLSILIIIMEILVIISAGNKYHTYVNKFSESVLSSLYAKANGLFDHLNSSGNYEQGRVGYPEAIPGLDPEIEPQPEFKEDITSNKSNIPQIALVIDDFGNQWDAEAVQGFLHLDIPLTVAILPDNWASHKVAVEAQKYGKEIIIHLPMSADHNTGADEKNILHPGMNSEQVDELLKHCEMKVHGAVGLNNHMGSGATQDTALMSILAQLCLNRGWIILDSFTHPKSVLYSQAYQAGVHCAKRRVFLDHFDDREKIRNSLYLAISFAEKRDYPLVLIGHPRIDTWKVIEEEVKKIPEGSLKWVYLSEACQVKKSS